jgi:hypothetical protein
MAKGTTISVFEQHVEKGALALSAIFLIVAIAHWVIQSPRNVEISSVRQSGQPGEKEGLSPEQVDPTLHQLAEGVKTFVEEQTPPISPPPDYVGLMTRLQNRPFPEGLLADAVGLSQPPVPGLEPDIPEREAVDLAALAEAVPPPSQAPVVLVRRELSRQGETPVTKIVAHVVMDYPWNLLKGRWSKLLESAQAAIGMIVTDVEIESRVLKADGSSADREVLLVSADEPGRDMPTLPEFAGGNAGEIAEVINDLRANWSELILRPGYWPVYDTRSRQWGAWTDQLPDALQEADQAHLAWRHDESVMAERLYSYRYRVVFINPIFASLLDAGTDHPEAAGVKFLRSDWSPWSEPASVLASTTFFMRSSAPQGFVRVTIFADAMGRTVDEDFRVDVGQTIGGVRPAEVPNPIGGAPITTDVDYDTGAVLVGLEDDKPVFTGRLLRTSVEMIYLDSQGQLRSRILLYDQQQLEAHRAREP